MFKLCRPILKALLTQLDQVRLGLLFRRVEMYAKDVERDVLVQLHCIKLHLEERGKYLVAHCGRKALMIDCASDVVEAPL